ncbi:16882_t:CDS:2 [Racocetra fulgida]|uniref:16882_t:CDS:1 n=1 Tax=Racocetra fulgida TaxID=60492 RepID=A0A9N8W4U9_9GLOM|nr:16882_t:CDS:2 [Racocetra fulgida]
MQKHIPLLEFDMKTQMQSANSSDSDCEETKDTLEKGVLSYETPTIYLRVSGNGRNVGRKIKHVMVTLAVLNDQKNILKPESHYTISLFSGTENYASFKIALELIYCELHELYEHELALNECKNNGHFVDEMRELICEKMSVIGMLRDGGNKHLQKSAILEILEVENRALYFWRFDNALELPKYKKLHITSSNRNDKNRRIEKSF